MWIVMDIGCIECGEGSEIVGRFSTKERAEAVAIACMHLGWRGGEHHYEVFELGALDTIHEDYREVVNANIV